MEEQHEFARISQGGAGSGSILSLGTGCMQRMIHGNKLVPVFAAGLRSTVAEQAEVHRLECYPGLYHRGRRRVLIMSKLKCHLPSAHCAPGMAGLETCVSSFSRPRWPRDVGKSCFTDEEMGAQRGPSPQSHRDPSSR